MEHTGRWHVTNAWCGTPTNGASGAANYVRRHIPVARCTGNLQHGDCGVLAHYDARWVSAWKSSFIDSTDSMDNAFWYRDTILMRDSFLLMTTDRQDSS